MTAVVLAVGVLAPLGYVLAPSLLGVVNATPEVRAQALPFLRIMFVYSVGMLIFFMLGGALRSAGDARRRSASAPGNGAERRARLV